MTYSDEDVHDRAFYTAALYIALAAKTTPNANFLTYTNDSIMGTILMLYKALFLSEVWQNSAIYGFIKTTRTLVAATFETTNPDIVEWEYESTTDKDAVGYKILPKTWYHYIQVFWNGIMDGMSLVDLKLALPSGWSLTPTDIDFDDVTDHCIYTRIRYKDKLDKLGNGADWSEWIDLDRDSGLHPWNLRNKIWVPLRTGEDWTYWDIKFKNSENWWYEASTGVYYVGTDEYWYTHGNYSEENPRAYYLLHDLLGTDLVPFYLVIMVTKTFKSLNLANVASTIFKQIGKKKIKHMQSNIDDILRTLDREAIDPKAFQSVKDLFNQIKVSRARYW